MKELTQTQTQVAPVRSDLPVYASIEDLKARESALPVPKTIDDLISVDSRQFIFVAKTFGEAQIELMVNGALTEICMYMNMELSGEMIQKAAELIVQEYPTCKIADLKLFERFMLTGKAGKLFRLDTSVLLECFGRYYLEREEAFAAHREQKHIERVQAINRGEMPTDERMKEIYSKLKMKGVDDDKAKQEEQEIKFLSPEEICKRNGIDYDGLLALYKEEWYDKWKSSGVDHEMSFDQFYEYRKKIFDLNIKSGKLTG